MILLKKHYQYLPLIIPALLVIGMFGFVKTEFFSSNQIILSNALAIDLLIGVPLLCYLIIRRTEIPLKSILKIFTLCLFISTLLIPETNLEIIQFIKQVVYPLFNIWIGLRIIQKIIRIVNEYRVQSKNLIGYALYSTTIRNVFSGKFGEVLLMEFSLLYFLFSARRQSIFTENEFEYSKNKGTIEMVAAFSFIIAIETIIAHILISKWSPIIAIISTGSSLYLIMLFVSILRSRSHFPISIEDDSLSLKSGYINKSVVKFEDISQIEFSSKSNIVGLMKLSAFKGVESHNIILHFRNPQTILKVFGVQKEYNSIGIFVDEPKKFINSIEAKLSGKITPKGNIIG